MSVASISSAVTAKAVRLHAEGKVREKAIPTREFDVDGDHGTYAVRMYGQTGVTCTCQARGTCSHIAAALLQIRADRDLAAEAFTQAAAV